MRRLSFFTLAWCLFRTLVPRPVWSNPLDMYGMGGRSRGMAGAYTAVSDDYSALYYNPAGLSQVRSNQFHVGYINAVPRLNMRLTPLPGITAEEKRALRDLQERREKVDSVVGYEIGLVISPNDRFSAGLAIFAPKGSAVFLRPLDSHMPTFILHDHYSQRTVVLIGASFVLFPGLSIGFGVHTFVKVRGTLKIPIELTNENTSADPNDPAREEIDTEAEMIIDFPWTSEPFFGVLYQPKPWLRVGGSYRSQFSWDVEIDADIALLLKQYEIDLSQLQTLIAGDGPIKTEIEIHVPALGDTPIVIPLEITELQGTIVADVEFPMTAALSMQDYWQPAQLSFGVAVDPGDQWTFSADATWYAWSGYPSPDMKVIIDDINISIRTLPANVQARIQSLTIPILGTVGPLPPVSMSIPGLDTTLSMPLKIKRPINPPVHDVIHPRVGVEYRFLPFRDFLFSDRLDLALRSGYAYEPSPFEADGGYTNLVDPDRHLFSLGAGLRHNEKISLDTFFQYRYLPEMSVEKSEIDKGMPFEKITAGGHILAGGLEFGVSW